MSVFAEMEVNVIQAQVVQNFVNVFMDLLDPFVKHRFVSVIRNIFKSILFFVATPIGGRQMICSQSSCQNGGTCQEQGSNAVCMCKPGFTGQRCETGRIHIL